MRNLVVILLFVCFAFSEVEIPVGCGGFVEASPLLSKDLRKKIDYSSIKVKLVTLDGALKDTTECTPNGYYYLPVYDKGNFVLRIEGPEGWSFEPKEVPVSITAEDSSCRAGVKSGKGVEGGEDINFQFVPGFSVSGQVIGSGCGKSLAKGPKGVTVTLSSTQGAQNLAPSVALTDSSGQYSFSNVFPGRYRVSASHASWLIANETEEVTVEWDSVKVAKPFTVLGFDVLGAVTSSGESVQGVDFLLYSSTVTKIATCKLPADLQLPDKADQPLCAARSSADGKFELRGIPCGNYTLRPFYRGANTTFDVVPQSTSFVVDQESVQLSRFQVMGFSVSGRVLDAAGKGVEGVSISVDGKLKTATDASGTYKLDQLSSGAYDITATKAHMTFSSLSGHRITPNAALPAIQLKTYSLCGTVTMVQLPPGLSSFKNTVTVSDAQDREIARAVWDASGNFCFDLAPGTYKVRPALEQQEQQAGLAFTPRRREISITSSPVTDANFSQAVLSLGGKVKCVETPCKGVTVELQGKGKTTSTATHSGKDGDTFTFQVVPGKYELRVKRENWCWEKEALSVEVGEGDVTSLEFVQTGFSLAMKLSHDVQILYNPQGSQKEQKTFSAKSGSNRLCLPKPGLYELTPSSCYKFQQDHYVYDTSKPTVLELEASQFLVKGTIFATKLQKLTDLRLDVQKGAETESTKAEAKLVSSEQGKDVYEYSFWGKVGDRFTVTPQPHSVALFYPPSQAAVLATAECPLPIPAFEARPGLFITGSVSPALSEVTITVAEGAKTLRTTTSDKNGSYSIGPLYDDKQYTLSAERSGYTFEKDGNNFKAFKLGQLTVSVVDKSTESSVPGVLLSLSRESYRRNNSTQPNGSFEFSNLSPGQYFIRPILKEYVFEPPSKEITIGEGADATFLFKARRVAYSCYGAVTSLNGEPEKFVSVEAVGQGVYEETQSDANGQFRLRGLQPNVAYEIRVKATNEHIERTAPKSISVTVTSDNVHNVSFVVFHRTSKHSLTGLVEVEPRWLQSAGLEVRLYRNEEPETAIKSLPLGPSNFFEFSSLPSGKYTVRVSSTLSSQIYSFQAPEQTIELPAQVPHLQLGFSASLRPKRIGEVTSAPIYALSFGLLVAAGMFAANRFYFDRKEQLPEQSWLPKQLTQSPRKTKVGK